MSLGSGATLNLYAATTTASLSSLQAAQATLNLAGTIDNSGATLATSTFPKGTISGPIIGGTLVLDGNPATYGGGLLTNLTVRGTLPTNTSGASGNLILHSLDGISPVTLDVANMGFGTGTLEAGTMELAGFLPVSYGATLTLAQGMTIHTFIPPDGTPGAVIGAGGSVVSYATIVDTAGFGVGGLNTINDGTLYNLYPVTGYVAPPPGLSIGADATLTNNGLISAAPGMLTYLSAPTIVNNGTIFINGGALSISGTLSGAGLLAIGDGGTIEVNNTTLHNSAITEPIGLLGANHALILGPPAGTTTVLNFSVGDSITLAAPGLTLSFAGSTLTASNGGTPVATFILPGVPASAAFHAATDAAFNTIITESIPCFTTGTRFATPSGPVAVERLRPGDLVLSAFGGDVPIVWIGHRRVDCRRHFAASSVWPIRIRAGALGEGLPCRDLRVSPEHALLIEGLLIPAGLLVNGGSIARDPCNSVVYWHIELPQHDVILAEGAPCESYLDTGNRADFDNGPVITAHPDFRPASANDIWLAQACAPQCREGPGLEAIRARLAAIAGTVVPAPQSEVIFQVS
ncbi:MAG: Hint domain-containing protein [Alphaproteobacteria bacterium]|nr:Hint domain-containing protein [Alphaproteobacteria bacterium]